MADFSFYIDDETAVFVKEFCEKSGVDFNTLMVMYCKQIALQKKIPMSVGIIQKKQDLIGVNFDFIRKFYGLESDDEVKQKMRELNK